MHVYFQTAQRGSGDAAGTPRPGRTGIMPPVLPIPPAVLRRHGARILEPDQAERLPGQPPLRPTAYRYGVLLVADAIVRDSARLAAINRVLARRGMQITVPDHDGRGGPTSVTRAVLLPRPGSGPVRIDAWTALQWLRHAAAEDRIAAAEDRIPAEERFPAEALEGITLEHLLLGTTQPDVGTDNGAWHGSPVPGGAGDTYGPRDLGARRPVDVLIAPPIRRDDLSRRPVVAVLDSGIGPNPWLEIPRYTKPPRPGSIVRVDDDLQDLVRQAGVQALARGDETIQVIEDYWDRPVSREPLVGELDTHTGHGTFIAGILAQVVPDADVLAVRVMHSDGILYEGDVLAVLDRLADRVEAVQRTGSGPNADIVDVVSMSFGFFHEWPGATDEVPLLQRVVRLLDSGVLVVAAAGNHATSEAFFPAALSLETPSSSPTSVFSVGALNPNASAALYSDENHSTNVWASGSVVVSTFPTVQGSQGPRNILHRPAEAGRPPEYRESLDPDDFSSGWATWSGTSFAAPLAAAVLTQALVEGDLRPNFRLDRLSKSDTIGRAAKAVRNARDIPS